MLTAALSVSVSVFLYSVDAYIMFISVFTFAPRYAIL